MNTNDVVKLAVAYAAGYLSYNGLVEALGNETMAKNVVNLVASVGVAGLAAKLADKSVDLARDIPVVGDVIDVADDVIEGITKTGSDIIDDLNPFSW